MHGKKMIAPIIITILFVLYYVGFACVCFYIDDISLILKIVFGAVPLILAAICVYVLIERIEEIRSGEEDDLSEY
ncbi:MAG: hypothetical protein PUG60_14255 [Lachnospiraceae bacterium]|nr:hypothetical protein [Lachnospiraceae bacterium]